MLEYFIFNGICSLDMGIAVRKLPPIIRPERNVDKIEIAGRDGYLTQDYETYKSILKTVECTLLDDVNIGGICAWLTGKADARFSNTPDLSFDASIINSINFTEVFEFGPPYTFIVMFDCQPYGKKAEVITISPSFPITIVNSGTVKAKPIIKVTGVGNITLTLNSKNIIITDLDGFIKIDSEMQDAYNDVNLLNNKMQGEFPFLPPGSTTITGTGEITNIEVKFKPSFI